MRDIKAIVRIKVEIKDGFFCFLSYSGLGGFSSIKMYNPPKIGFFNLVLKPYYLSFV